MELEKVFVLYGKANIGKTTTLNLLIELLKIVSESYEIYKDKEGYATFYFNGNTIGVCTPGDDEETLKDNLSYFKKQKCNIAFTATRTKGAGKDFLNEFTEQRNISPIRILKDDDVKSCKNYAAKLFQLIAEDIQIDVESED